MDPLGRDRRDRRGRIEAPEELVGYQVYDPLGQKIGSLEKLFVNGNREPEYVRVKIGLFASRSVLIPVATVEVDERQRVLVLK